MNKSNTKVMMENDTQIEKFKSYIYLAQIYSIRDKNQDTEIQRRITAEHRDIFKGNIGTCLKRQIYNSCVLPAMTYGVKHEHSPPRQRTS